MRNARPNWLSLLSERARRDAALVVGVMSGTSADGVDAALVEIRGQGHETRLRELSLCSVPYPQEIRERLFRLFAGEGNVEEICRLNVEVAEVFADAVSQVIRAAGVPVEDVLAVGSHGQTVWHIPRTATLQIGEPAVIAARTGIPVVSDFRAADVAHGGEGAPLVPYFDWLLFTDHDKGRALQNIGGIANVTHLPPASGSADVLAFDTGPGNALMDAAVAELTDGTRSFDVDGEMASHGSVDEALLETWLKHCYLTKEPPKSTGRELFGVQFAKNRIAQARTRGLSDADILATLTAFTARSIADAYAHFLLRRGRLDEVIVSGGGSKNPTLMRFFVDALSEKGIRVQFRSPEEWGVRAQAKEAMAFALFARESLLGIPTNLPSVTGAERAVVLGTVTPAG